MQLPCTRSNGYSASLQGCQPSHGTTEKGRLAHPQGVGRFLKGAPQLIRVLRWQEMLGKWTCSLIQALAGCHTSCRSTSGGVWGFGSHTLKSWPSTLETVSRSSAEAELYARTKGAALAIGFITIVADLQAEVKSTVHTDTLSAISIVRRAGLGKLRHLNVRYVWFHHGPSAE